MTLLGYYRFLKHTTFILTTTIDRHHEAVFLHNCSGVINAHANFLSFEVDVNNEISDNVRIISYDGPLTDLDSDSLVCNEDLNLTTSTKTIATVVASSTVRPLATCPLLGAGRRHGCVPLRSCYGLPQEVRCCGHDRWPWSERAVEDPGIGFNEGVWEASTL